MAVKSLSQICFTHRVSRENLNSHFMTKRCIHLHGGMNMDRLGTRPTRENFAELQVSQLFEGKLAFCVSV